MEKKVVLVLRADLARALGRDVRNAKLSAIEPFAFLQKGTALVPLFALDAVKSDPLVDFAALQKTRGFDRITEARRLEGLYGKGWQSKYRKQQLAAQTGETK